MPAGVGYEPTPCLIASQAFTAPRPEITRPLSHGGRVIDNVKSTKFCLSNNVQIITDMPRSVYSSLLSTDARCVVIKLSGLCDNVRSIGVSRYTCDRLLLIHAKMSTHFQPKTL